MTTSLESTTGSYLTPTLEHARVADAMRANVLSCRPELPLRGVARLMSSNHVHSIVVGGPPWRLITDLALVGVRDEIDELVAGDLADGDPPMIGADRPLREAAAIMSARNRSHVLVLDPASGRPVGMVSSLDLAGIIAWGEA